MFSFDVGRNGLTVLGVYVVNAIWPDAAGRPAFLPFQDIITPDTSIMWNVNYPAGTFHGPSSVRVNPY